MLKRAIAAVMGTRHERERRKIQPIVDTIVIEMHPLWLLRLVQLHFRVTPLGLPMSVLHWSPPFVRSSATTFPAGVMVTKAPSAATIEGSLRREP